MRFHSVSVACIHDPARVALGYFENFVALRLRDVFLSLIRKSLVIHTSTTHSLRSYMTDGLFNCIVIQQKPVARTDT